MFDLVERAQLHRTDMRNSRNVPDATGSDCKLEKS